MDENNMFLLSNQCEPNENENSELQTELRTKPICRFCLTQQKEKLGSIYARDTRFKTSAPLPVQVMAIASIEVYTGDGMPSRICTECRVLFEHSYRFKQMCKKADTLLRQYPFTGKLPEALPKPRFPHEVISKPGAAALVRVPIKTESIVPVSVSSKVGSQFHPKKTQPHMVQKDMSPTPKSQSFIYIHNEENPGEPSGSEVSEQKISGMAKSTQPKILNSNPAESPEPPAPKRFKKVLIKKEASDILSKFDNEEEISLDDVKNLIAAANDEDEFLDAPQKTSSPTKKPKLLNKSSIRILNKEANVVVEPRLSKPQVKTDEDGNVAVVSEILDPNGVSAHPEPDPVKTATRVETNVFPCPKCERSFPLQQLRDMHMINHNRVRRFQCSECEKSFYSKYDLQKHNLIHTGDKPFKCPVCDRSFTRSTLLHRHQKIHTDIPKLLCVYCEKAFISKEELEKHTERHLKNRPYECKICNKSFAFKQGLERHEVVHTRNQPFACHYCEQSFSTASKLARHLTAHAGKRPYPCKFCTKSYLLSHHLTRHMRSHKQSVASFKCSMCKQTFNTIEELLSHSSEHLDENLSCPLCKEVFENKDAMTGHIKVHGEGDSHACEFCDLIFISASKLQKHTDEEHASDMIAYHESDKKQKLVKDRTIKEETDDVDLQKTLEEMLVDQLSEADKTVVPSSSDVKEKVKIDDAPNVSKAVGNGNKVIKIVKRVGIEATRKSAPARVAVSSSTSLSNNCSSNMHGISKTGKPYVRVSTSATCASSSSMQPIITSMLKVLPKDVHVRRTVTGASRSLSAVPGATSNSSSQSEFNQRVVRSSNRVAASTTTQHLAKQQKRDPDTK